MTEHVCQRQGCGDPIPEERGAQARYCSLECKENRRSPKGGKGGYSPASTRRCRNKDCIERFIPVNPQHWYHEPACAQADASRKWTVEEILSEEGAMQPAGSHLELAKAAFGQKNRAMRENARLVSLREYLTYEIHGFYDENPQFRFPRVEPPTQGKPANLSHGRKLVKDVEIIVQLGDWQIGKWENGFGVDATRERVQQAKAAVAAIVQRQRDAGYTVSKLHLSWGGDMIEGCYIYRGQNVSGLDKTGNTHRLTTQIRTAAHWMADFACYCASLCDVVENHVVGGNHGRPNGPNDYADKEDNFDVMAAWWAEDVSANTKHVTWHTSEDWWIGFDVAGHYVVSFHGDQWQGPLIDLKNRLLPKWISNATFGRKPKLVLTHHRHTYEEMEVSGATVLQNGTIDGGSKWYTTAYGEESQPRQRIIVVSAKHAPESTWPVDFA